MICNEYQTHFIFYNKGHMTYIIFTFLIIALHERNSWIRPFTELCIPVYDRNGSMTKFVIIINHMQLFMIALVTFFHYSSLIVTEFPIEFSASRWQLIIRFLINFIAESCLGIKIENYSKLKQCLILSRPMH